MDLYTIDVETYYDKEYSLAKMSAEEYIADERFELISVSIKKNFEPTQCYFASKAEAAIKALPLSSNAMLAQNTRFDALVLSMRYGVEAAYYFDTMLMANAVVRPFTGSSSLAKIAEQYKIPMDKKFITNMLGKRYKDIWAIQKDGLAEYNKRDVEATYDAFKRLMYMSPIGKKGSGLRFPRSELDLIDLSIRMYLHPVIEIDHELAADHAAKVEADREALRKETGLDASVLRSMQKTCEVLRGMGVEVPKRTKKEVDDEGNVEESEVETLRKTDPRVIALLAHEDERVRKVVECRLAYASNIEVTRGRRIATIGERFGKLRVPLNYYGAHTGRFSGADKLNLQNLGRASPLRKALRAPRGHAVVAVDAAQIEARVNAWLSGEQEMLADFANGEDLYAKLATSVFGYEVNKAEHPVERFVGKVGELSLGYGAGYPTFHNMLYAQGYKPKEGEDVLALARHTVQVYRDKKVNIRRMWARAQKWLELFVSGQERRFAYKHIAVDVRKDFSCIWLPNGMPLTYVRPATGEIGDRQSYWFFRGKQREFTHGPKLVENIVQATARIIVTDVALEMKRCGWPIALTVHDDLIWVVPDKHAQEVYDTAVELLSTPPSWAKGLPLSAEGKIAETYGG